MKLNNAKIKFLFLLKFFFLTDEGLFRRSYFFQIIGLYLGALIISLTFSIMQGMEDEIFNKIEAFNYKGSFSNKAFPDDDLLDLTDNFGKKALVRCETRSFDFLTNAITYDKFNDFVNGRIKDNLLYDEDEYHSSSIIIGESLSEKYGISVGDTITLSDIVNINIVTGHYTSNTFIVANIFKFKFLNFDYDNVFIKENHGMFLKSENYNYYIDDNQKFDNKLISSDSEYSLLISSIQFEKKLYILLGILTIIISSIMVFNNTLMVLLEKKKQFKLLNSLGISLNKVLITMLFCNVSLSLFLSTMGLLTTLFIEKLNLQFYPYITFSHYFA